MSDGVSKVGYCKEQYCIPTWQVRSMNQGKLDVVKQEMARLNIGHLRNQIYLKNGQLCKNLIQRITISTTVGKNPLEERE